MNTNWIIAFAFLFLWIAWRMRVNCKRYNGRPFGPSWRTSIVGYFAIGWGLWLAHILWVPSQTVKFNLIYALANAEMFIVIGIGLLFARDNNVSSEEAGVKRETPP